MTTVILGGAACVWGDFFHFELMGKVSHVVAVNDAGVIYPWPVDVWASLHPELMPSWLASRARRGYPLAERFYFPRPLTDHEASAMGNPPAMVAHGMDRGGASGLFATLIALSLWRDNVVLCGVPMTEEDAHFFSDRPWTDAPNYLPAWLKARAELTPRVRSMSGWTMGLLGRPDTAWIKQEEREKC